MKKVLIIGAGAQGVGISWVFSRADDVSEIVLGSRGLKRMSEIVETNKSSKLKIEKLDASDVNGMVKLMKDGKFDLVVNATLPAFNDPIMEACYEAKTNYLDMATSDYLPEGIKGIPVAQLRHAKKWQETTPLQAFIMTGSDPGTNSVMAKEAADELDEIDSIKMKDYAITESEKPIILWQPQTYLEDLSTPPWLWDNGYRKVPPFSGEEEYDFPHPINAKGKVYYHAHEEVLTIPKFIGKPVKYVDFKMGEPAYMFWKSLIDLGLMSGELIEIEGRKIAPKDVFLKLLPSTPSAKELVELTKSGKLMSRLILTVDVYGKKGGKDLHYRLWTEGPNSVAACEGIPGVSDVSYHTAVSAAIFALMMLRGQVNHAGVFPPEVFNKEERETYFKELRKCDIKIHKEVELVL